jgi:hypothetical protein
MASVLLMRKLRTVPFVHSENPITYYEGVGLSVLGVVSTPDGIQAVEARYHLYTTNL